MQPALTLDKSKTLFEQATKLIPGGVAGIRRPYNFVPGEYPTFLKSGKGGRVTDVDGNEYIDMLCAYGPIILGHVEEDIDNVVKEQMQHGFCLNLAQEPQNQLAQKLSEIIPCAEMSIMVKTGSDATTAAVRAARAHTDRVKILRCGYHGWHNWCVEVKGGIPEKLYEDIHEFRYNDLDQVESLLKTYDNQVAGIIVTPVGHPLAKPVEAPQPGFLEGLRTLADHHGCVLIFDEIRTGFRASLGGAQERYGVTPDLACFGKAMANGYPISALCGKRSVMQVFESKAFLSSTYFPNSLEMLAALACIEKLEKENVIDYIWEIGQYFLDEAQKLCDQAPFPLHLSGIPPMPFITFPKDNDGSYKQRRVTFYTSLIRQGVFLQPYHHGYFCYRHSQEDVNQVLAAIKQAIKDSTNI